VSGGNVLAVVFSLAAGLGGAIQVAVMGRFGERIGIFEALAFATLLTALITAVALVVARRSFHGYDAALHQPPWLWVGSLMGALIVFAITLSAPRVGTAATIGLVIAGNLVMGAIVDRFGLFGLDRIPLHWPRLLGIALLGAGAALSLKK
jgi:bacterial/archaeal transporter family-2 protein